MIPPESTAEAIALALPSRLLLTSTPQQPMSDTRLTLPSPATSSRRLNKLPEEKGA